MNTGRNNFYSVSFILLLINSTFISKCTAPLNKPHDLSYTLKKPDKTYVLQKTLKEVSGLSFVSDKEVALIEDENGAVFFFNLEKGMVTRKISFAKDGDYEDLKIIGDTAYILRSDGKLVELKNLKGPQSDILETKYQTGLSKENNTEGLCYDDKRNMLLIACKGSPGKDNKYKNKKAIYSFNLQTKKLSDTAVFLIDVNQVELMAYGAHPNFLSKLMRFYRHTKEKGIEPSGLAIHPVTRDIYVISSVGKELIIIGQDGKLKKVVKLAINLFKQPEGIAFDSSGNLYITNEGRNGKGNILKFLYLKNDAASNPPASAL
ncbi:MAG: SdiA-regulated domain-containing protein [Bacteroidia bacterium]